MDLEEDQFDKAPAIIVQYGTGSIYLRNPGVFDASNDP